MKKPSFAKLLSLVEKFNKCFPVGTQVVLKKDLEEVDTEVTHEAYVMGGHSAVAFFRGISGCYSIENNRIRIKEI